MTISLVVPLLSNFMQSVTVEKQTCAAARTFGRGDILARLSIEMDAGGDALACPPREVVDLLAGEAGLLASWHVAEGETVAPLTALATIEAIPGRTGGGRLRCAVRSVLE